MEKARKIISQTEVECHVFLHHILRVSQRSEWPKGEPHQVPEYKFPAKNICKGRGGAHRVTNVDIGLPAVLSHGELQNILEL